MEFSHPGDFSARPGYESDSTLLEEDCDDESADEGCCATQSKSYRSRSPFTHDFSVGKN